MRSCVFQHLAICQHDSAFSKYRPKRPRLFSSYNRNFRSLTAERSLEVPAQDSHELCSRHAQIQSSKAKYLSPDALVDFCRSLPAKSTRFRHECRFLISPLLPVWMLSTWRVKTECDLEDSLFMAVSPTCLQCQKVLTSLQALKD